MDGTSAAIGFAAGLAVAAAAAACCGSSGAAASPADNEFGEIGEPAPERNSHGSSSARAAQAGGDSAAIAPAVSSRPKRPGAARGCGLRGARQRALDAFYSPSNLEDRWKMGMQKRGMQQSEVEQFAKTHPLIPMAVGILNITSDWNVGALMRTAAVLGFRCAWTRSECVSVCVGAVGVRACSPLPLPRQRHSTTRTEI